MRLLVSVCVLLVAACGHDVSSKWEPLLQSSATCGAPAATPSFSSPPASSSARRRPRVADSSVEPECRMSTNGQQACGYHCKMGTDGVFVCADTPNGVCAMSTNGRVTCSELAGRGGVDADDPPPDCHMGTNGQQTCGYNCRMGTNGRYYCASTPNGTCAMNTNGTFTCS
jgi:hypothetical protein